MNPRRPLFRHLAIVMINALFWHPVVVLADGIVVAPGGNTRLDQAGNGVPVVNIATPNDKGLSHNRFRDYNVDARGLILNNATGKTQSTQLGGIVVGNANLRGQAAQVILNEVNGGNPSRLAGYTEVAGQAAKVVVANPYGISCDGCGFINSPRVTLTTGAPVIEDGRLDHYAVDQGQVAIEGLGLDAREVDQFEILTRAAALNAELHAQDLTIVAGANDVDAASLNATPRSGTGSRPALAIDSSALGGMYAERIRLVGTDAGVGVRLAGDMAASAGDIRITADGQLRLADASTPTRLITQSGDASFGGDVHADQGADIQADDALDISGRLTSGGDIALSAQRLTTTGDVVAGVRGGQRRAGAELAITAATLDNRGRLDASDRLAATTAVTHNRGQMLASELALTSRQSLDNGGEILADRVSLNATQLTNQGLVEGQRVVLTADVIDQQGRVQADHASLSATRIDNQGTLYAERLALSAPDLVNRGDQATLSAGSSLELETRRLANLGGSLVFAPGQDLRLDLERFDNQGGRVVLDGSLSGDIGQWNNAEGQLAAKDIALSAAWVDNRSGLISAETGALALASDGEIINTGGTLQARQGSLTLTAAELDNQGGKAVAREALTASVSGVVGNQDGGRFSARQLSLSAQDLDNRGGEVDAAGALNVSLSESLDNAGGRVSAGQLAIVARHLDNPGGQVVADGDLTATLSGHLANRDGGTLGAERVVLTTGQLDNRDGALLAGDVRIHSQTLDNARGMISADDALALTVTQALANRQGQIQVVEGGLEARLGSLDNQQGTLVARRLSVASQGAVDNRQGQLVGDELRLDAGSLDNRQDGRLTASYLTLAIDDALDNQGGVLDADQGELQVAARRLDNRGGTLSASQLELNFGLDPDQGIDNRDGGLLLADDLRLTAGSLSNTQGRVLGQSLVLTLAELYNAGGLISATQALGLALNGALDNQGGRLQVTDGQLQLSDATQVDNRQGVLVAQQLSLVDIGRLDNRQGQLVADGIRVAATTVDNTQQGLISAAETLELTVQEDLANASGTLEAARLNVAATRVDNTQGRLLADRIGLRATTLGNQGGAILAERDGAVITLTGQDAELNNADGVIDVADGTLAIVAAEGAIHNQAGSISADRLTLEASSLDNHDGQLAAVQGNAAIQANRLDNQAGLLAAQGGELTLDIATVDNRAGRLQGDGVRLTGARLDNRQGTLTAVERDLEVQLSGALDNGDGRMLANGVLGVDSATLTNLGGQLAGRGLSLTTGMLDNQQGLVESSAALSVDVDGLANGGGTLRSLSGQTTTLSARQRLDNRGGVIELGSRDARVNAADIDNRDGTLRHDGDGVVQLVAEQLANLNGRLQGTGGVSAELGRVEGVGQWQANGPLVLASDAALSVGSNERLSSAMALSLRAAGLINAGLVAANDRLTLTLDGALNNTGQLSSQGRLAVTASGLTQDGGRIASAGDSSFRLSGNVTNLGRLTSQGDMTLSAASLDNQGTLGSLGDLRLDSASITNAPDTLLFAGGDMTLHTQQLFNRYGDIYSRGDLTLARNSALAKADRLENRSGTIEAEGDMTLRAGDILNTKDRIETEDVLLDRAVAGTGYVRKVYRTEHNGQGAGDGGYEEVVTLVSTTELFREYELTETLRTTIVEDSPAAGIQAGGDLRVTADTLENLDSVIAANGDIRIDAASLINSGRGNALVTRTSQYGDAEAASCLETGSFLDCFRGGILGGGRYSYRFRETDLTDSLAGWNAASGFSDSQELLPLPAGAPDLLSQAETRTILPGGAPAVISAGGRVSITATEQLHNGDIQEHTLAQLQGRLGDAATQGPVSTLSMTLGRDADQASAQGLSAPSRVDRSGASRDASLADIGATPSTAGGGLDGALDASVGAGFDAGGGVWVFDDAPFLRVDIAQTPSFRLPEGDYGLFVRPPEAQGRYLVETNPEFTNLEQWRGSDYLLDKLGYTDDEAYRLLGDGRYESRLIRQAVLATTGQRYLSEGLGDDYAQYRYLMDNALASKDRLSLALGVSLSPEQVAALTHDIVWLEERQIDGQTVLAPVLYLANLDSRDVRGGGVIQGRDIDLISGGDLVNVGTLRATHDLNAYAAGSVLQGGLVEAGDALNLTARDDIRNAMGGQIRGDRVSLTALEGDVVNDRLSVAAGTSRDYRSYLDQGGSISARDQLDIQAGRDVVNRGNVTSGADVSVTAGRDIVAGAVVDVSHWQDARGRDYQDSATTLGSTTTAGGDLTWQAGRDIAIDASQVLSGDDLVLAAGRDMAIVSGEDRDASRDVSRRQITTTDSVTQVGSTLEAGGSASLSAGGDIGLLASRVEAGEGLGLVAGGDITLASAANASESHTRKPNKTYDTRTVRQQGSELAAGTDLTVAAGGDLTLVASTASAGDEAYLYAGGDVALLAANDEDYSRYEKNESGGLFGGDKHRLDEVQDLRAQGSEIASGGDLIIVSDGDQTYEGARLDAGNDLVLDSGGEITFAHARDLHSETHEKSSSNAVWQSAKGEGETVETLRQSELVAQGERIIRAAQGVNVDIEQVDEQSIHQTITAMVEADPSLAWLAEMEARGDVDWRAVKALHDQWDYDHSGMSAAAQLVVAIVVAYFTAGAASELVAAAASSAGASAAAGTAWAAATTTTAAGWANAAATAALTGMASNAAVSTINQQGDLGEAWSDVTSSDALRGYAVAAATAGLTSGLYDGWTGTQTGTTTGLPNSGTVTGAPLGTWQGAGQFGANQLLQNTTSALLDRALGGDAELGDALQASLANTFAAAGFNAIGNTSLENGSLNKAALHAVMGGLAAEAAGGDFTTGALAAGANELLVDKLAGEYSDLDQADKGRLLVMNSQIIGVIAAEIASNDDNELQIGAQVAGSATQYNYLSHQQIDEYVDELDGCEARGDCGEVQAKYRDLSIAQQDQLISVCSQDQAACLDQYQSLVDDSEKFRQALDRLGDENLPWSVALDQGPLLGQYLEAESAVSQEGFAEFLRNEYDLDTDEAALISAAAMAGMGGPGRPPGRAQSHVEPSGGSVSTGPRLTIRDQYLHHKAMTDDLKTQLSSQGYRVSDKEISFGNSCGTGRCRPDIVYETPDGKMGIIEVKTGNADLTIRQSEIYPQINSGDAVPRGKVARAFDLRPGIPLREQGYPDGIPIEIRTFPGAG